MEEQLETHNAKRTSRKRVKDTSWSRWSQLAFQARPPKTCRERSQQWSLEAPGQRPQRRAERSLTPTSWSQCHKTPERVPEIVLRRSSWSCNHVYLYGRNITALCTKSFFTIHITAHHYHTWLAGRDFPWASGAGYAGWLPWFARLAIGISNGKTLEREPSGPSRHNRRRNVLGKLPVETLLGLCN